MCVCVYVCTVVDGDDLSRYDRSEAAEDQGDEDNETLDQLEWELASQSGRITGEFKRLGFLKTNGNF